MQGFAKRSKNVQLELDKSFQPCYIIYTFNRRSYGLNNIQPTTRYPQQGGHPLPTCYQPTQGDP